MANEDEENEETGGEIDTTTKIGGAIFAVVFLVGTVYAWRASAKLNRTKSQMQSMLDARMRK